MERPLCTCHQLPKARNGIRNGKQDWRCAVKNREHYMAYYDAMTGVQWSAHLLRLRRWKGLKRKEQRGSPV